MKYCSHCGAELRDEAVICPSCGCPVENVQQQPIPQGNQSYSALSIIGVVFAFLSPLIGLILSIVAGNNAKSVGDFKSASLAKTGTIISAVFLVLYILIVVLCVVIVGAAAVSSSAAAIL
jgi:uncharacterized membrane protein YvbJ